MAEEWLQHLVDGIKQKYHEAAVWSSFVECIEEYAHDAMGEFGQDVTFREGPLTVNVDSSGRVQLQKDAFPYLQFSATPDYGSQTADISYRKVNPELEPHHTVRGTPLPCYFAVSREGKVYLRFNGSDCHEPQEAAQRIIEKLFRLDWPQYCSLNYPDSTRNINAAGALALPGPQVVVAHLALDSAGIDPVPAGDDALLKDLPQDCLMQGFPAPSGE